MPNRKLCAVEQKAVLQEHKKQPGQGPRCKQVHCYYSVHRKQQIPREDEQTKTRLITPLWALDPALPQGCRQFRHLQPKSCAVSSPWVAEGACRS